MSTKCCKVGRVIDQYEIDPYHGEFDDIDRELLALWKGEGDREPHGYRSLAEWFNKQLLRSAYDAEERMVLGTQLDEEFATLTGDDDIARGELVDKLKQDGIDGTQLYEDMISFSTLRRHLTDCLDGEKERQEAETDWEENSVEIASERLVEKVEKALSSYETKGDIEGATRAEIGVQIQLSCPECATRRTLTEALRRGYVCETHLSD
jgi:hypothetical protein